MSFPDIAADLRRFPPVPPEIFAASELGGRGALHGYLTHAAVNSDFVVPGYPTLLAAINFDRTGTTRIGKYVINHSFMRGGLVTIAVAIGVGFLIAKFLL